MDPPSPRPVLVCVFSLLLASSGIAVVDAVPGDRSGVDEANPINETVDGSEETNETDATLDGTATEFEESLENTTDETEGATNETAETVDGATTTVEEGTNSSTADETTESLDDAVDGTTSELDGTVERTSNTVEGTVDLTADTLHATVTGTKYGLDETESESTTDDGSHGPIPGTETSRNESSGARPTTADDNDEDDEDGEPRAATAGGSPSSGSGPGPTVAGLLAIAALSSSIAGTTSSLLLGTFPLPRAGRIVLRILHGSAPQPWKYVLALRFSRHDGSDVLDHEHRRAIHDAITDTPGVYLSKLGERSDLSLSSVRHHLRVLEREALIETEKIRGKRRFYPVETDGTTRVAALSDSTVRRLLETLAALGEARNDRLADELDRSPSTISHHLSSLEEDGLVVRERDGRATVNRLPPAVANSLGGTATDGGAAVDRPRSDD